MKLRKQKILYAAVMVALVGALSACSDSDDVADLDLDPDPDPVAGIFTIDASAGGRLESRTRPYVYVDITTGEIVADINDDNAKNEANKDRWHIAFKRTHPIQLNGGVSGAADVAGAMAVGSDLYDAAGDVITDFANLNKESEYDKFRDLTFTQATALDYTLDAYMQVIKPDDWAVGDASGGFTMTNKWWIVRGGNGSFVKMRVTEYNAPNITIEYYFAADADTLYPVPPATPQTYTTSLGASTGSECIDFDSGAAIANCDIDNNSDATWDLLWEKNATTSVRNLWTNGGVKGANTSRGGALGPREQLSSLDSYTKAAVFTTGSGREINVGTTKDSAGGIFSIQEIGAKYGWGEYSLAGNNKLWPNFRVWTIRTGANAASHTYYKMQILAYYNLAGESGHFTYRLEELTE